MREMTISEVARRTGVRTSAIRYYETLGVLPTPVRVNGQRRYTEVIFDWLTIIHLAREAGFTLAEIKVLSRGFTSAVVPAAHWRPLAIRKRAEADALVKKGRRMQRLLDVLLTCDCEQMEDCRRAVRAFAVKDQG